MRQLTSAAPLARSGPGGILRQVKRYWFCYLMISGTLGLALTFSYYPAASALYHSFTVWDGFRPPRWVGLSNYQEILADSVIFRHALRNMLALTSWEVARSAIFPLLAAVLIYRIRSEGTAYFFRLLFVLPVVVPPVINVLVWQRLLNPTTGLLNAVLGMLGAKPLLWLNGEKTALPALMFVGFPWIHGIDMLIFLAGLLAIPIEIIEAGIVDGVGPWRRFFAIELPLIIPQLRLLVIVNTVYSLQGFSWQLLATRGGPNNATTVPAWEMYRTAINGTRFGVASAIGVLLFAIIFILTLVNNARIRSTVEYQANE